MSSQTSLVVKKRSDTQQHSRNVSHFSQVRKSPNYDPLTNPYETCGAAAFPSELLCNLHLSANKAIQLPLAEECVTPAEIEREFLNSGYPLQGIRCHEIESTIVLSGIVCRYYYVQIALQLTQRLAGARSVVNKLQVIRMPSENGR